VRLLDIAISTARKIIVHNTRRRARREWLNYEMINYLGNPTRATSANVRSAVCRCRLIRENLQCFHAAAKSFAKAVSMPIAYERGNKGWSTNAHFVESQRQIHKQNAKSWLWKE
jgi:hypothetical protein